MYVIKFQLGSDIRRLTSAKPMSWNDVVDTIHSLFDLTGKFTLKYKDEEGDLITVSTDRELVDAYNVMGNQPALRFTVVPEKKPVQDSKATQAQASFNPQEVVLDIDVGRYLPFIQNLIQTYSPHIMRRNDAANESPVFHGVPVHHGVTCDGCGVSPIQGIRWKCSVCPDYDLCEKCNKEGIHKEHPFAKIVQPRNHCWRQRHCCPSPNVAKKEEVKVPAEPKKEVPEQKEVPKPVEQPKEVPKAEEPKKVDEPKQVPKPEVPKPEVPKPEPPKEIRVDPIAPSQWEEKLRQLADMGFTNGHRNLAALVKHNGDMVQVVMDLLAL